MKVTSLCIIVKCKEIIDDLNFFFSTLESARLYESPLVCNFTAASLFKKSLHNPFLQKCLNSV